MPAPVVEQPQPHHTTGAQEVGKHDRNIQGTIVRKRDGAKGGMPKSDTIVITGRLSYGARGRTAVRDLAADLTHLLSMEAQALAALLERQAISSENAARNWVHKDHHPEVWWSGTNTRKYYCYRVTHQ